jgi:ParB family transcriptional regulator, chromosome partitioning protein
MADLVRLIDPSHLRRNPDNPRLIFRADELNELETSIKEQGILVPLTLYQDGRRFYLLDGERRWRCAMKLGLASVPAIVQPKPDRLQNIMMMFAIHNARRDWDPLPSALKLLDLEDEYKVRHGYLPTEKALAQLASLSRGEVRRLRNLLALPEEYRAELLAELQKPRSEQVLTIDHVLETTRGVGSLHKRGVIEDEMVDPLRRAILAKFRSKTITNTVAPRKLARIARAVERDEVSRAVARRAVTRLMKNADYSIDEAFSDSVEQVDREHATEQLVQRLDGRIAEYLAHEYDLGDRLREALESLSTTVRRALKS